MFGRALIILLLPVAIFVFIVGWVSYRTNELENSVLAKKYQTLRNNAKEKASEEGAEVEIIENLMENLLKV